MEHTNTSKLSTWILWAPLKFAATTFCAISIICIIYSLITTKIFIHANTSPQTMLWLCATTFIICATILFYKLPHSSPDRTSFIATHNLQTILTSIGFILASFFILQNANEILLRLIFMSSHAPSRFIITIFLFCSIFLYLIGILLSNFFLKIRRIQSFKIPTWKIICSIPFGFSALWTPGYILKTKDKNSDKITIKSNWYKRTTHAIESHQSTTITIFTLVTILSGFIFGIQSILLTFILTLIFGIWVLTIGTKKFIDSMPNKYATFAVIINIALILILAFSANIPNNQTIISISETTETINL